jgi:flagellar motor switch protein FliN
VSSELKSLLVAPFFEVVSQVLAQIGGKAAAVEVGEPANPEMKTEGIEIALRSDAAMRLRVQFGEAESQFFAKLLVGEAVADASERQATVEELWRQIAGRATTELKPILKGGDLDVVSRGQEWISAISVPVQLRVSDESALQMVLHVSEQAAKYFRPESAPVKLPAVPSPPIRRQNLDLLLDVPLSVTLRFGERRMPLREILQLNSGAVIELNRHADEPVELFLDERVIARGNVVVIDGCYGLRVTEVCSPPPTRMQTGTSA